MQDITPQFKKLPSAAQALTVPYTANQTPIGSNVGGLSVFSNSFKRGQGAKVFGSDEHGIWLGAPDWENAPFRVAMNGDIFASSATGSVVIDTENNRIVVYDANGVPRVLIGRQVGGF